MASSTVVVGETGNSEVSLSSLNWTLTLEPGGLCAPELPEAEVHRLVTEGIPAKVPGNVYDALLTAGLIPDPFIGVNEQKLHWIARQNWTYKSEIPAVADAKHHTLVFYGLDTVAEVVVGGKSVGSTLNMHRTYQFDVTEELGDKPVAIEVRFTSPYTRINAEIEKNGKYPSSYEEQYNQIRKMAANFGWDWGPIVVTAGIWKEAVVLNWDEARLTSTRIAADIELSGSSPETAAGTVIVSGKALFDSSSSQENYSVRVRVIGEDASQAEQQVPLLESGTFDCSVSIPSVQVWWPHTLGEQPLYTVEVSVIDHEGKALDSRIERVGFRKIEMVNEPSADPDKNETEGRFGFKVNGRHTFAKGWNWIPNDPLVDRVTESDYRARLADVKESGADWVRVWGGGIFEDDIFYDVCDEYGILVWQDFPFACAAYPETPEVEAEVRAEATDNVERLMSHPSLAVWNGNNENFMGAESWGWTEQLGGKGWGSKYYLETLPSVVSEVDPLRPYWPGSPYSGVPGQMDNNPNNGTFHSWEVWNQVDYIHYLDSNPTFMAEFGWQSPPAWSTLVKAVDAPSGVTELDLSSPEVMNHQKALDGMKKLERGVREHFGPKGLESTAAWHYLTQIVQARAIATGVGHWRSLWPRCQGAFIWQINDCWPVISWAGVDVDGRRKPMWYEARKRFANRLLTLKKSGEAVDAFLVNQEDSPWSATLVEKLVSSDGTTLATKDQKVTVEPNSVKQVTLTSSIEAPRDQLLVVEVEDLREVWIDVPDYEFNYAAPSYLGELEQISSEPVQYRLTVTAESLIRELVLQADRIHPALDASTEAFTLLPGESCSWTISVRDGATTEETEEAVSLLEDTDWSFPVLASVGDILG